MPITRTPMVDNDGTGLTGTPINNAWKQELYNQIDNMVVQEQITLASAGNYSPVVLNPAYRLHLVRTTVSTAGGYVSITGFTAGQHGDIVIVEDINAEGNTTYLYHEHTGEATAANRLSNFVYTGPTMLVGGKNGHTGGGTAMYLYDSYLTRWRLIAHEQGGAFRVPFNAANYEAMTATSGNIIQHDVYLKGRMAQITLQLTGVTPNAGTTQVNVAGLGYTIAATNNGLYLPAISNNHPTTGWGAILALINSAGSKVCFMRP